MMDLAREFSRFFFSGGGGAENNRDGRKQEAVRRRCVCTSNFIQTYIPYIIIPYNPYEYESIQTGICIQEYTQ